MRALLAALFLLLLLASPAAAQQKLELGRSGGACPASGICSDTPPNGVNDRRVATTAWVAANAGGIAGSLPLAQNFMYIGNASNLATAAAVTGDLTLLFSAGNAQLTLRNSAGVSVIGRSANSVGAPADIASTPGTILRNLAGSVGFGSGPTLGAAGTATGRLDLAGITSGLVSVQPVSAAGTYNFNLPTTAGTAGQPMLSGGGGAAAQTYGTLGLGGGGTGQTTAAAARAASGLNVESFRGVGDTNATIAATDQVVGTNAAFTASHTWTLPAANAVNPGQRIIVFDFFGGVTGPNSLVISRVGADTINGGTSVTIAVARGGYILYSDGVSAWAASPQGSASVAGVALIGGLSGTVTLGDNLFVSGASIVGAQGGFVNKFRNPGMDIIQRGASGSTTAGTATHTADGWAVTSTGAAVAWAVGLTSITGSTSGNNLSITGATSVTNVTVRQRIEGSVAAPLKSLSTTVQAKWLNSTGGTVTPTLTVKHANALDDWSASTTDVAAQAMPACTNGSSCTMSFTFTASASARNGLEITWDFGNNFSTSGKIMTFTDADIRASAIVAAPEIRPIGIEMPMNQRYYYRRPARGAGDWLGIAQAYATGGAYGVAIPMPQPLRAQATATISAATHVSARNAPASSTTPFTAVTFIATPIGSVQMATNDMTGSGLLVAGNATIIEFNTASGFIEISAEL